MYINKYICENIYIDIYMCIHIVMCISIYACVAVGRVVEDGGGAGIRSVVMPGIRERLATERVQRSALACKGSVLVVLCWGFCQRSALSGNGFHFEVRVLRFEEGFSLR